MTAKRSLKILVTHGSDPKVNVTIPLALAKLARVGGIADRLASEHGIDLDEIIRGIDEMPDGKMIDVVDGKTGDHVEIFVQSPDTAEKAVEVPAG